jgi:transposase
VDQEALVEYRYRAVCEVLGGSPIGEVAVRYGTTRQSLDTWRTPFKQEGMAGLFDRSRRPHTSPTKLDADVEALICRMRRDHPRWGGGGSAMSWVTTGWSRCHHARQCIAC